MDPTAKFFRKLKNLAVRLETETAKLQRTFENQKNDDDDVESSSRAMRTFHEVNCEVQTLKGLVNDTLSQQNTHESEVSNFIKNCKIIEQNITEDISKVKSHWEKYGYHAPHAKKPKESKDSDEQDKLADTSENNSEVDAVSMEEAEGSHSSVPNVSGDLLRTPQLSDFGLCEMQLKRKFSAWLSETPQMPELSLSQPSLKTPELPLMPLTPKCVLQMDEHDLQTPQMVDFGISDQIMFLNNDFTMNLFRKDVKEPERSLPDPATTPVNIIKTVEVKDGEGSPERSVVCALEQNFLATPELPAFNSSFMNHLVSKSNPVESHPDYDVPELVNDDYQISVMPKLESQLGNTLLSESIRKRQPSGTESFKGTMDMDGPTQEFNLKTPRVNRVCLEPSTPEMPDLSSITQDICKLVSQTKSGTTATADAPRKGQHSLPFPPKVVKQVTESEFLTLPAYLRQMSLPSLNQTVVNINQFISKYQGEKTEFLMEELTRITKAGTKAPIYILCLRELKRLKLVGGARNTSVYRLNDET